MEVCVQINKPLLLSSILSEDFPAEEVIAYVNKGQFLEEIYSQHTINGGSGNQALNRQGALLNKKTKVTKVK